MNSARLRRLLASRRTTQQNQLYKPFRPAVSHSPCMRQQKVSKQSKTTCDFIGVEGTIDEYRARAAADRRQNDQRPTRPLLTPQPRPRPFPQQAHPSPRHDRLASQSRPQSTQAEPLGGAQRSRRSHPIEAALDLLGDFRDGCQWCRPMPLPASAGTPDTRRIAVRNPVFPRSQRGFVGDRVVLLPRDA